MRFDLKRVALAFLATSAMISSFVVQANTAEVKISGTITPESCTPQLGGSGVVDFGDIGSGLLEREKFTLLPEKKVSFTITCPSQARVAVKTVDNRSDSVIARAAAVISGRDDSESYGLGKVSSRNVGIYTLDMEPGSFKSNGVSLQPISSTNQGERWYKSDRGELRPKESNIISWSSLGGTTPVAFTQLAGNLKVTVVLNTLKELALTGEVPLDGLATIEMIYL